MKQRTIVSAVIEKENQLLFGKKKENIGPYPNTWHLLGGGIEEETLEEALKREVHEESNIEIEIVKKLGFDEDYEPDKNRKMTHYIFLVYLAKYISGEPKPKDDIEELKWIPKKELDKYSLTRPSIKLFKEIGYL